MKRRLLGLYAVKTAEKEESLFAGTDSIQGLAVSQKGGGAGSRSVGVG